MTLRRTEEIDQLCVLFCGGGTGGHLTPGLSVAEEFRRRRPEARLVFAGTGRGREREWVASHGFEYHVVPAAPWGLAPGRAVRFAWKTFTGMAHSLLLEGRIHPDLVVGLGGYGSLAPGLAAVLGGRPAVLLEQNAIPGKANRLLSRWAKRVCVAWEDAAPYLKRPERVRVTGNPIRPALRTAPEPDAARRFGLAPDRPILLVMGGSLGAAAVNFAVTGALQRLAACAPSLQVLHSAGRVTYGHVAAAYRDAPLPHRVLPFIDDMAAAYAAADFVLCRAGGTSLAEITAAGLPSALVPLPIAANDHQTANARVLERAGAALIIEQTRLTPDRILELARTTLTDPKALADMGRASRELGAPDAAERVVDEMLGLLHGSADDDARRRVA